jgi:hypothetical protein
MSIIATLAPTARAHQITNPAVIPSARLLSQ